MARQRWTFKSQQGFFTHDDDPESWDFRATTRPFLGIKTREYATDPEFDSKKESTQWQRLEHYVRHMNTLNPTQQRYKIFYIIRHGQGVHNVKYHEVGREEWDGYWSKLSGDGNVVWEDAELTPFGKQQAEDIASFFGRGEVPLPDVIFSSPLRRCLGTTEIAYKNTLATVGDTSDSSRRPLVKEKLRERLGVHFCDKRSTRSYITSAHPLFKIEVGFTEEDELWKADVRETLDEHMFRATQLLEDIFERGGDEVIVSLTAHSGALMALFGATGWRKVPVAAGAVYPLLVVAEKVSTEVQ
ncbi:putative phosphoglycerate mutase pmu1 [Paraconiothyrium brasiliense]|uniref:Phosphoglycerate mutase pmu1 n=1 Tax=Paraconiothyrium brasiliense TaxID=300254 RepID=A0ABR3R3E0_9PLEO